KALEPYRGAVSRSLNLSRRSRKRGAFQISLHFSFPCNWTVHPKRPCAQKSLGLPLLRHLKFPYPPKICTSRSVPANPLLDKNCKLYRRRRPPTSLGQFLESVLDQSVALSVAWASK